MSIIDEIKEISERDLADMNRAFDALRDCARAHPRSAVAQALRALSILYGAVARTHEPQDDEG